MAPVPSPARPLSASAQAPFNSAMPCAPPRARHTLLHMDSHALWAFLHLLLFAYWLGADVGVWLTMAFVRDARLQFETRATLIRLAFYIDLFPRVCFALILPVGLQLARNLGLYPVGDGLLAAGWTAGILWSLLHFALLAFKGRPVARLLRAVNKAWEAVAGGFFIAVGAASLATGAPLEAGWFALKILLFGTIFWISLGIDTVFQPFTTLLRMGPGGSTPAGEARVRRLTHLTMAWALLLYAVIAAVAFLGRVKPPV